MFEAPPPPMDAPLETRGDSGVSEAGAAAAGATDSGATEAGTMEAGIADLKPKNDILFFDQGGMFEAPPPPMDAPIKKD